MSATPVETCALHRDHGEAIPLVLITHHIQPRGMGGPDVVSNRVRVCDNGHRAVHTLMGPLANGYAMPAEGTASERAMAQAGYDKWVAAGKPGDPHAAYGLHGPAVMHLTAQVRPEDLAQALQIVRHRGL